MGPLGLGLCEPPLTWPSHIRQLSDVACYAPRFIEGQRLGDLCIAHIGVAVDLGERLTIRVHDP